MSQSDSPERARGFVRGPQEFWGGLALVAVALFAFWALWRLPGMSGFQFGPGTAPRVFASILMGLGLIIVLTGLVADGPRVQCTHWRGPLLVSASVVLFAAMIQPMGLIVSTFTAFVVAASASAEQRWKQTLIVGVGITVFCSVLFPRVLGLPFELLPVFVR
jgi:putative tricarboxylic transport membrane protein